MLGTTFEHSTIRRYVIVFGKLFDDIYINRADSAGNKQSTKVPLIYAPKDKMLTRANADPDLNRPVQVTLPRMGFEIINIEYDGARKQQTAMKFSTVSANTSTGSYVYSPVPYNFYFNLYVAVRNAEDGTRILEQILPYFTPEFTVTTKIIDELNINLDIPVSLLSSSLEDNYDSDMKERRVMMWTLTFSLKGTLFGPIHRINRIKTAIINLFTPPHEDIDDAIANSEIVETITITPGLTSNGEPTSNSNLTVSIDEIDATDNYGYIVSFDTGMDP
jgi:hypothetical protein